MIDNALINNPPEHNRTILKYFENFPVYLLSHQLTYHRKVRHIQPGLEITFTHEGRATFVVGHQSYIQTAGSLMIVPGHIPHQVFIDPMMKYKRTVLCIDSREPHNKNVFGLHSLVEGNWFASAGLAHLKMTRKEYIQFIQLVRQMEEEMKLKLSGWRSMLLSQLMGISVLLQRKLEQHHNIDDLSPESIQNANVVDMCCQYIQKGLQDDLSLQRMAKLVSVSPEHLTRLFRKEKGMAYYRYVLLQRIEESKRLLIELPELSVTDIAHSVGFSSSVQYSRMFKQITGLTPSDFRRING